MHPSDPFHDSPWGFLLALALFFAESCILLLPTLLPLGLCHLLASSVLVCSPQTRRWGLHGIGAWVGALLGASLYAVAGVALGAAVTYLCYLWDPAHSGVGFLFLGGFYGFIAGGAHGFFAGWLRTGRWLVRRDAARARAEVHEVKSLPLPPVPDPRQTAVQIRRRLVGSWVLAYVGYGLSGLYGVPAILVLGFAAWAFRQRATPPLPTLSPPEVRAVQGAAFIMGVAWMRDATFAAGTVFVATSVAITLRICYLDLQAWRRSAAELSGYRC